MPVRARTFIVPSADATDSLFPHPFIPVRKKKRVSYLHYSTNGFGISCMLRFSRGAMPSVRARRASARAVNPAVFTRNHGSLIDIT